jgi:hypothetical protein
VLHNLHFPQNADLLCNFIFISHLHIFLYSKNHPIALVQLFQFNACSLKDNQVRGMLIPTDRLNHGEYFVL